MLEEPEIIMKKADEIARRITTSATLQEIEAAKRELLALSDKVKDADAYREAYGERGLGLASHWLKSTGNYLCLVETDVLRKMQKPDLERKGYKI